MNRQADVGCVGAHLDRHRRLGDEVARVGLESIFALSNGHLGWRANLDEGEPLGLPGTYLNGVNEVRRCLMPQARTTCRSLRRRSST
ncbi:MAG: hypothetical protein ACLPUO_00220 [Streptosporangiaceae bacterium]